MKCIAEDFTNAKKFLSYTIKMNNYRTNKFGVTLESNDDVLIQLNALTHEKYSDSDYKKLMNEYFHLEEKLKLVCSHVFNIIFCIEHLIKDDIQKEMILRNISEITVVPQCYADDNFNWDSLEFMSLKYIPEILSLDQIQKFIDIAKNYNEILIQKWDINVSAKKKCNKLTDIELKELEMDYLKLLRIFQPIEKQFSIYASRLQAIYDFCSAKTFVLPEGY